MTQGTANVTSPPGGPLSLQTPGAAADLLLYSVSGDQLLVPGALVVESTTRFVDSNTAIGGSLRSPLMANVSFGNHVVTDLMIT